MLARPGYSAHPLIARVSGTETVEFDLDGDLCLTADVACAAVETLDPDIVCVANPNNPTGLAVDLGVIRAIHDASRALVVVDEAYVEFGGASAVVLLEDLPRLAVCRTFSKAFRLAGIRLGYLYAHGWVIDDLRKVRLPYHLDSLTQQAGLVACELAEDVTAHIDGIALERERVHEALEAQGLQVYPSAANFLLFRSPVPDLFDRLLDHGVLVRDFSTRPRLEGCLRVSIGTPEENDRFIDALKECLL
jgi:histidinol-phosphate aminotransferase